MQQKEADRDQQVPRELSQYGASGTEIMAGFINFLQGPLPMDEAQLTKGLVAASQRAGILFERFVGESGRPSDAFSATISKLEAEGLLTRNGETWIIPEGTDKINTPSMALKSMVMIVFKKQGIVMLESAAEAARQVWSTQKAK